MTTRSTTPLRLGISSCLLGKNVRYDGGHKRERYLTDTLGAYVEWVPVCPELECGLGVPRRPMHLAGKPPRLVVSADGSDLTERMHSWIGPRLEQLAHERLCGYVFKSKSPSCGLYRVKVRDEHGMPHTTGRGLFAEAFTKRFPLLPVEEEGRLHDAGLRENFIERVFVARRLRDYEEHDGSLEGLIRFHARHRCLIMAHSPEHPDQLGSLLGSATPDTLMHTRTRYAELLAQALSHLSTPESNAAVLAHLTWHLRHVLTDDERKELDELIERYRGHTTPLLVPLALIQHHVRRHNVHYLHDQWYLHPHPDELMLRNRA